MSRGTFRMETSLELAEVLLLFWTLRINLANMVFCIVWEGFWVFSARTALQTKCPGRHIGSEKMKKYVFFSRLSAQLFLVNLSELGSTSPKEHFQQIVPRTNAKKYFFGFERNFPRLVLTQLLSKCPCPAKTLQQNFFQLFPNYSIFQSDYEWKEFSCCGQNGSLSIQSKIMIEKRWRKSEMFFLQDFEQKCFDWCYQSGNLQVRRNIIRKHIQQTCSGNFWKNTYLDWERKGYLSRHSFGPKFCVLWPRKMPASGWGSLWESSSFVPWFSTFVFRNFPGTVSECVRICWFKRNSSNLDRAPKMRDCVLLNSWDRFLLTLSSISSETCGIYSSLILGTDVFRDWPFLGFSSCVSLVTAANLRLFLNVAIFLKGKCYAIMKTELVLYLLIKLRL